MSHGALFGSPVKHQTARV